MNTIPDPVFAHANTAPNQLAIEVHGNGKIERATYSELNVAVESLKSPGGMLESSSPTTVSMSFIVWILRQFRDHNTVSLFENRVESTPCAPSSVDSNQGPSWRLSTPFLELQTSGSTSKKQSVHHSLNEIFFSTMNGVARLGHHLGDKWYCPLPVFRIGGAMVLLRSLLLGSTAVFSAKFSTAELARAVETGAANIISLVPTMLAKVIADFPLLQSHDKVRAILVGGGPLSPALADRATHIGLPICQTYGATETCAMVATEYPLKVRSKLGLPDSSIGIPLLPYVHADTSNNQLTVSGPQVGESPWQSTDLGKVVGRHLSPMGRADRVIICGGKKLHPDKTEAFLNSLEEIGAAVCLPWPDPGHWGTIMIGYLHLDQAVLAQADSGAIPTLSELLSRIETESRPKAFFYGLLPRPIQGKFTKAQRDNLLATIKNSLSHHPDFKKGEDLSIEGKHFAFDKSSFDAASTFANSQIVQILELKPEKATS